MFNILTYVDSDTLEGATNEPLPCVGGSTMSPDTDSTDWSILTFNLKMDGMFGPLFHIRSLLSQPTTMYLGNLLQNKQWLYQSGCVIRTNFACPHQDSLLLALFVALL